MLRKRFFWKLFIPFLATAVVCLLAIGWVVSRTVYQFYLSQTQSNLLTRAELVRQLVGENFSPDAISVLDSLSKSVGEISSTRITFIYRDGKVLGDSDEDPALMENHADRPEFRQAMTGEAGMAMRFSPTLQVRMTYLALPVRRGGEILGVVRTAIPIASLEETTRGVLGEIALGGLLILGVAAVVTFFLSRWISRPIEEMKKGAELFSEGRFDHRVMTPASEELRSLSEALNQMAERLNDRINAISRQRNELEAVLSSMMEGVLAIDVDERIINVNNAARKMLGFPQEEVKGRSIQEVVLNPDFQCFTAEVLQKRKNAETEISLNEGNLVLQVQGTPLYDPQNKEIGAVIVLNDVTKLHRLENVRREFVANVSHELRTPITSIKGFVETLRDGAIKDENEASRFLKIIANQTDRLNQLIEDLLSLSKLEQEAEKGEIELEMGDLQEVVNNAVQNCLQKATDKKVQLVPAGAEKGRLVRSVNMLEQALINLVDNAINYSNKGSKVEVGIERTDRETILFVRDFGCGIEAEHLPRIFERFYRVDKTRSRNQGGTGLGLAIVKHIARAHGGKVSVESTPGQGSTFRIHLPSNPDKHLLV